MWAKLVISHSLDTQIQFLIYVWCSGRIAANMRRSTVLIFHQSECVPCSCFHLLSAVPEGSHLLTIEALVEFVPDMTSIWDLLGYGLGMRTEVDNQKVGQGGTTQSRCLAVLQAWLEQCRDASWEKLLTMIWKLEKRNLADRIYNSIRTTT